MVERRVAQWGLAAFVLVVAAEHALRPGLAPGRHFISEYGRGWTAPLQSAAFAAWAASLAAAALLVRRAGPPGRRRVARTMAVSALAVAAVGAVLCAAFATQTVAGTLPAGVVRTTGGRLHDLGTGLILVGELVAALAATRLLPGAYRIEVVVLAVALLGIVPLLVALGIDAPGWGQRAVIAVGCVWQWRLTVRVRTGALSQDARRVGPGHGPGT